jgi:hypothetical protein
VLLITARHRAHRVGTVYELRCSASELRAKFANDDDDDLTVCTATCDQLRARIAGHDGGVKLTPQVIASLSLSLCVLCCVVWCGVVRVCWEAIFVSWLVDRW